MLWKTGEIYYIGGSDTFPSPLNAEEEALMVGELGGETTFMQSRCLSKEISVLWYT